MKTLLIAGTDTNVGKTILTNAWLASYLQSTPETQVGLLKLMQTGEGDREFYQAFWQDEPRVEIVTPLQFTAPLAPPIAAALEGKRVNLETVWKSYRALAESKDLVLIEGIGGLGTPVTFEVTVADIARDWHLETILVVPVQLGAIAQTVANAMYARYAQVQLKGIILSCLTPISETKLEDWTPIELLESLTEIPVLGVLSHLTSLDERETFSHALSWRLKLNSKSTTE